MKKISFIILLITIIIVNISCSLEKLFDVKVIECNSSIEFSYDESLNGHIPYKLEDIPKFTLRFEDSINIAEMRRGSFECVFTKNDDFVISNIIKGLIDEYSLKNRISFYSLGDDNEAETWMNKIVDGKTDKVYIKVKDSKVINEICYITLENGLQLTFNYAKIIDSNNNIYYRWQKTESIRMILHYPLMVINKGEERQFVFIPLPNQVTFHFDTTTKTINDLLTKDKFLEEEYYTFKYQHSYDEDYINYYNYYVNNFNGRFVDEEFIVDFLGQTFIILFNEENFIIKYKY